MTRKKIYKAGFTLMETLIAVLILSLAIAGPLTIAEKGIQVSVVAKDQENAFFLAQDAVEYVRWARDTNSLNHLPWLSGGVITIAGQSSTATELGPCVSANGSGACYLDSLDLHPSAPLACASGVCPAINYDPSNTYYSYTTGNASIFTRTVSIKNDPLGTTPNEAIVTVTVSWCDQQSVCSATPRKITVYEDLFNWQ